MADILSSSAEHQKSVVTYRCTTPLYKTECIRTTVFHQGPYRTIGDVDYATAGWLDCCLTEACTRPLG